MSQQFNNINSGALFANDKRRTETSPTHKGQCEVCCPHCGTVQKYWISAWVKVAKNKVTKFFSFAFTADETQQQPTYSQAKAAHSSGPAAKQDPIDFDDDIPF